jgi:hypothetical protein
MALFIFRTSMVGTLAKSRYEMFTSGVFQPVNILLFSNTYYPLDAFPHILE